MAHTITGKNGVVWLGTVNEFDDFSERIERVFIDGATKYGAWAIMTPQSWVLHGAGRLGLGHAQMYTRTDDGRWVKVAG